MGGFVHAPTPRRSGAAGEPGRRSSAPSRSWSITQASSYEPAFFSGRPITFAVCGPVRAWFTSTTSWAPALRQRSPLETRHAPSAFRRIRQINPVSASDGTNYLLVWSDGRRGERKWDIYGTRITASGTCSIPAASILPAWKPPRPSRRRLRRLPLPRGLDRHPFQLTTTSTGPGSCPTARSSTRTALPSQPPGKTRRSPTVASNGENFLVAWWFQAGNYDQRVKYARVSRAGNVLDIPAKTR